MRRSPSSQDADIRVGRLSARVNAAVADAASSVALAALAAIVTMAALLIHILR